MFNNEVILTIAQAILANTKVIQSLVDHLPAEVREKVASVVVPVAAVAPVIPKPVPVVVPVAAPVMATPAPVVIAAPAPVAESPSEPAVVTIEQLSAAVTAAATRGPASRDALIKLLTERGVKRASELPKDQWAGLLPVLETL
jgi:hypothetical protein